MTRRRLPIEDGFRHPGDFGQGPRFPLGFTESRVPLADASYQGYGAYATLDGTRVDESEYAELDYTGVELEPELTPPDHTGRGPRGYRRSDESIRDDLHVILTAHDEIDASDVEVLVERGEVLLRGRVRRRATKRLIEDIAYQIAGVRDVTNLLRIGPHAPAPRTGPEQFADDNVESKPRSTRKDDHPSRRDAWISEHLRDRGTSQEAALRAIDRRDLRSHVYTGPRDTSAGERVTAPERPLIVSEPRWPAPEPVDEQVELDNKNLDAEELEPEDVDRDEG
jgi:hypothetical protein